MVVISSGGNGLSPGIPAWRSPVHVGAASRLPPGGLTQSVRLYFSALQPP